MDDDWTCFEFAPLNDLPKVSGVYFLMNGVELVLTEIERILIDEKVLK